MLAEVFPPGDFIREELEARDWSQSDLAEIMGRPTETINRIITGKLAVTPETARGLGAAFGTSAEMWLNLESQYQLSKVDDDTVVARRARIFEIAPVKNMVKRGWIESSSNVDVLEQQVVDFFELSDIDESPKFQVAARKSTTYDDMTTAELAWYFYCKHLASSIGVPTYSKAKLKKCIDKLVDLASHPQEVRHVPEVLADAGVRFVVVKHLPKSKLDGAAFWLDKERKSQPVIAVSMRLDRIDSFWFTLAHEIAHILNRDAISLDSDMVSTTSTLSKDKPEHEKLADEFAANMVVPRDELDDFIVRVRPYYAKKKIAGFANRIKVHPGIVVGQLQYREEIGYSHSREMLEKVRDILIAAANEDGWSK